jgi:ParB-like chromosome segregation protein Spo0J
LRPAQGEISRKRIKDLIAPPHEILKKVKIPLIVSKNNYIVDGHHRWAAYRVKRPEASLPVVVIDAPIKDVLGIAVAWGAKHENF